MNNIVELKNQMKDSDNSMSQQTALAHHKTLLIITFNSDSLFYLKILCHAEAPQLKHRLNWSVVCFQQYPGENHLVVYKR